jgi:hypothetical protein
MAASGSPFEGKWVLDKKSDSAKTAPGALQQEIKIDGNTVLIKSRYDQPKNGIYPLMWVGIMAEELKLNGDGSETRNHLGPFEHVSKTTIAPPTMRSEWIAGLENGNVTGEWIRTLSPDGKEMTLQIKGKASDGRTIDQTITFKRK